MPVYDNVVKPMNDLIREGGPVVLGIALLSFIAWALIFWEWQRLYESTGAGWIEIQRAVAKLQAGDPPPQLDPAHEINLVGRLLRSEEMMEPMDRNSFEARIMPLLRYEQASFERPLYMIAVLATCMPLLGLLGTVFGMIQTFSAITAEQSADADSLAGGISQALITTQVGLVTALAALLVHGYLRSRTREFLDTMTVLIKKIETAICYESDDDEEDELASSGAIAP